MLNENFDPSHLRGENVASKLFKFHLIMYLCMLKIFISFRIDGVAEIRFCVTKLILLIVPSDQIISMKHFLSEISIYIYYI